MYIYVRPYVVGSGPFTTEYESDLKTFPAKHQARSHGFQQVGSDDFLIGKMERLKLLALYGTRSEPFANREDRNEVIEAAKSLGIGW